MDIFCLLLQFIVYYNSKQNRYIIMPGSNGRRQTDTLGNMLSALFITHPHAIEDPTRLMYSSIGYYKAEGAYFTRSTVCHCSICHTRSPALSFDLAQEIALI